MDRAVARAVRFRHVIFPDSVGGYGRAVNLARVAGADGLLRPRSDDDTLALRHAEYGAPGVWVPEHGHSVPECHGGQLTPDAESFLCGLFAHVGLGLRHYKPETLRRRLPACLRALRATSLAHARSVLQRQPRLAWDAVDALVIGVTSFFRDATVFEALRRDVLPALLAACRGRRPLRVWSAGCSDGAELYSVAMLLADLCAGGSGAFELVGTDCRPAAVARAAAGAYERAAVAGVPPDLLRRHFDFDQTLYRVRDGLRASARWRVADATRRDGAPPGPFDLVLCRNLVIYLQPAATASVWASLADSLRPGGVLVPGKAERPLGLRGMRAIGPCLYRKGAA